MKKKIIVIVGPNASGKSEFGVRLAKKINGEIISADSRQVYKKLDVGSGKVGGRWRKAYGVWPFIYKGVRHHCIDIADPKKVFTADDYRKCAQNAITDILSRGKTPIIVGGTGFYIDAALGRVKLGGVPPNHALRRKLEKKSAGALFLLLKKLDPKRAKNIDSKNPRRLIRAIEIAKYEETNASSSLILAAPARGSEGFAHFRSSLCSETMPKMAKNPFRGPLVFSKNIAAKINTITPIWIGIKRLPEELKKRIHGRLMKRLAGIIKETKKLHRGGLSWKRLYDLGLEYRYASLYLRGELTKTEMTQKILTESWHYAKRQMTWFRRNKKIHWISSGNIVSIGNFFTKIL